MEAISAFGMVFMTYYVYKLTNKESKRDSCLRHIIELYYKIENESKQLISSEDKVDPTFSKEMNYQRGQSKRRIAINCIVMQYYLIRIPGFYKDRLLFWGLLHRISQHPDEIDNYIELSDRFQNFLVNYRDKKFHIHSMNFNYDGRPIEN